MSIIEPFSDYIHGEKYRNPGESFREAMNRVAWACADDEDHYKTYRDILINQRFLPGGRVQAAMGLPRAVTPYNCFVSGTVKDTLLGRGGIMDRQRESVETMRMGGGIGYDFSTIRPRGESIQSLGSQASGPVSFMKGFDANCQTIASAGHRRGAQMGVLRVDHPDIEEFIHVKQNESELRAFNISVAVTNEFMQAVKEDQDYMLRWKGKHGHRTTPVNANSLWQKIMRSTWDWAEPGVLFIDQINEGNNLWYCETIAATNPCGEQPLPPHGACLLGSFNLTTYLYDGKFNFELFKQDIPTVVRSMDNVINRATYPLQDQQHEAYEKRRMGLGVTGAANTIEAMGHPYGSESFLETLATILSTLRDGAYLASVMLAKEKGEFTLNNRQKYLEGKFIKTLPSNIIDAIWEHGIRNSHLLSIAPTGTISLTANNVSSGIEPVFAYEIERVVQTYDGPEITKIQDYGYKYLHCKGKTSEDCSVDDHVQTLLTAQQYIDSSVSKTCNVPAECSWEDFQSIYFRVWEGGAKGCTTYKIGGMREGILNKACEIDPQTGERSCE